MRRAWFVAAVIFVGAFGSEADEPSASSASAEIKLDELDALRIEVIAKGLEAPRREQAMIEASAQAEVRRISDRLGIVPGQQPGQYTLDLNRRVFKRNPEPPKRPEPGGPRKPAPAQKAPETAPAPEAPKPEPSP